MAFVNYNNKEITIKVVYYGPALSGKTTCLRYIYSSEQFQKKGKLITLDTDGDRTLFFDFLPLEIGKLGDYSLRIQLYTVPGQVSYDTTRKLVLQGADGVVFVADSQVAIREQNISSFNNLKKNLLLNNISFSEVPIIFQYNKRDLKEILPIDDLNKDLNPENKSFFPTVATNGENILEALHTVMKMVIISLKNKLSIFQKDKTVMFSREEITASSPEKEKAKGEGEAEDPQSKGDTEKEEIFELGKSMIDDQIDTDAEGPGDDDIFDLGDDSIIDKIDPGIELPDVELDEELTDEEKAEPGPVIELTEDDKVSGKEGAEYRIYIDSDVKNAEIPIRLIIPRNKDEVKLNLNLRIDIKKK